MKYIIKRQHPNDERMFTLEDNQRQTFFVDIYTDGGLEVPKEVLKTAESFNEWLKSLVGKEIEIEEITPMYYSTTGKVIIN